MFEQLQAALIGTLEFPGVREGAILLLSVALALFVRLGFGWVLRFFSRRTVTDLDDRLIEACRSPAVAVVVLAGLGWAVSGIELSPGRRHLVMASLMTLGVLFVSKAAMGVGGVVLEGLSRQLGRVSFIQPKTLPLLEMVLKVLVAGGAVYFVFVSWGIDVKAWLASAGIIGIAVGFAAKDTLANLFSGIFIIADAPYKVGDFIILDNGIRGQVVDIGIRSTRVLTRDDVEVTVPNAVIGSSKIINETAGRHPKMRVRIKVGVAYGSDVDQVRRVLLSCVDGVDKVCADPSPRVRFRAFGDSSLDFELLVWAEEPLYRGRIVDALNERVYKGFASEGIEIPFSQMDVHVKSGTFAAGGT